MDRSGRLLAVAWCCGWLGGVSLQGAAVTLGGPGQIYEIWRAENGWQQSTVTAIAQSQDGYLWLGTYHGLVRFDGVRFTVFDAGNTRSLQNGVITSLYEDPRGVLWIGHETGQLTRLADGQFHKVALEPGWPGGVIETITSDEAGDVWLLNDTGTLFRVRDGHSVRVPGGASPTRKAALSRARSGRLWLVANGAVFTLEQGRLVPVEFADSQPNDFYERAAPAQDGGVWLLGNERLRKWREGRWVAEMEGCPRAPGAITTLLETRSGTLLAGTLRDGLYLLALGAEPLHFSRTNGLSHNWIRALCEDREGNIWVGTGGGFDGLRSRKVQMLIAPDGWQGCGVLSFIVRTNGAAWIGTEGAGLYHYDQGQWTTFGETSGLSNLFVWSVLETRQGDLYVGTFGGGLLVRRGDHFVSSGDLAPITAPVVSLYQGHGGELWIGTTTGLHRYENGQLTWSAGKDQLVLPDVRTITESSDGTLWFGMSGGGLGCWRDGVLKQFRQEDGLGSDFVLCLYADPDGTLWIGTADHGLTRLKQGRFTTINSRQGLPSNIIFQILDDGAGNLWMGSQNGIFRARKTDLQRCADGLANSVACLSYGKAEGLISQTCSGGFQPSACRSADGRLWFPTPKGLAIVDPANVTTNTVPPPVAIEELLVDGVAVRAPLTGPEPADEWTSGTSPDLEAPSRMSAQQPASGDDLVHATTAPLVIPPGRQQFEFHYTGLSFSAPGKVRFKYRLEGWEPKWVDAGSRRLASYSYLPPGTYAFHVIACNNDDVWNETGAALAFTVLPYFWQTWWFRTASAISGAGALSLGVLWASRRRLRHKLELLDRQRALERERARIARDIHDDLGSSLTRITLLSQSVRGEVEAPPEAAAELDQIYDTARELTRAMDEIVWAVNPKHDSLDSLVTYLGRFAQHFLSAASIRCRLNVPMGLPPWDLTAEVRHNVFLAFKEALHNVVKHAGATEVRVSLELQPGGFQLVITDNGRGFDPKTFPAGNPAPIEGPRLAGGNGLLNMQRRLEEAGGRCEWDTAPGEGTRVRLLISVAEGAKRAE